MTLQYNLSDGIPFVHEGQDLLTYTFLPSIPYEDTATIDHHNYFELHNAAPAFEKLHAHPFLYPFYEMDPFFLTGQYSDSINDTYNTMFNEEFHYFDNMVQKAQFGIFPASDNFLSSFPNDFNPSTMSPYNITEQWHTSRNIAIDPGDMYQSNVICSNLLTATLVDMNSPETIVSEEEYLSSSGIPTPISMERNPVAAEKPTQSNKYARKRPRNQNRKRVNTRSKSASKAAKGCTGSIAIRAKEDRILVECKEKGMTFPEIMKAHDFKVAESTLRGRYRAITKNPSERPRKPEWSAHHIKLLLDAVPKFRRKSKGNKQRVGWTDVRDYIKRLGGYQFAPATCSRKYKELTGCDF